MDQLCRKLLLLDFLVGILRLDALYRTMGVSSIRHRHTVILSILCSHRALPTLFHRGHKDILHLMSRYPDQGLLGLLLRDIMILRAILRNLLMDILVLKLLRSIRQGAPIHLSHHKLRRPPKGSITISVAWHSICTY